MWSQIPIVENDLRVIDFKIIDKDTLMVHWYPAISQNQNPTGAIAFFLEKVGGEGVIHILIGKLCIFLTGGLVLFYLTTEQNRNIMSVPLNV